MSPQRPLIYGEVLFDCFPDGSKTLGGAPFNVAWHLCAFGLNPQLVSRVGSDPEGEQVRAAMAAWNMDTAALQHDPSLPTGRVSVRFDNHEPQYTIHHPAAFDAIDHLPGKLAVECTTTVLYHGSLALRSKTSRQSLEKLQAGHQGITFMDVNLRPPWWNRNDVLRRLNAADWIKLNQAELNQLSTFRGTDQERASQLMNDYELSGVILTRGSQGAFILDAEQNLHQARPQGDIQVVDTVGAGDAFTSVALVGLVKNWPLEITLRRAQDFASRICGQRGATVQDARFYKPLIKPWSL